VVSQQLIYKVTPSGQVSTVGDTNTILYGQ